MAQDLERTIPFSFPTKEIKTEFQIFCIRNNISMNKQLGELVVRFLREVKGVT